MKDFHYISYSQEVIFGHAAVTRLAEALNHAGLERLLLCVDDSIHSRAHRVEVEGALSARLVDTFELSGPRIHEDQLNERVMLAEAGKVDAVAGFGDHRSVNAAKALAFAVEQKLTGRGAAAPSPITHPLVPVLSIPATYAGSEMTSEFAVTRSREHGPRRVTTYDPGFAPRFVAYDPSLTADLPPDLTAAGGMRALAHCFEALYSVTRHPLSRAAALSGIQKILGSLLASFRDGGNLVARAELLEGAHLAGVAFSSVAMGLHHVLCHALDEISGIPHGIADSVLLPHMLRFNADATAADLLPAAELFGVASDGHPPAEVMRAAAQRISELAGEMSLPHRLRDAGVKQADLHGLAQLAFEDPRLQNNPRRVKDAGLIEVLLNEAW